MEFTSSPQLLLIITKNLKGLIQFHRGCELFLPLFGKVLASCEVAQMWVAEGWERKKNSANIS